MWRSPASMLLKLWDSVNSICHPVWTNSQFILPLMRSYPIQQSTSNMDRAWYEAGAMNFCWMNEWPNKQTNTDSWWALLLRLLLGTVTFRYKPSLNLLSFTNIVYSLFESFWRRKNKALRRASIEKKQMVVLVERVGLKPQRASEILIFKAWKLRSRKTNWLPGVITMLTTKGPAA